MSVIDLARRRKGGGGGGAYPTDTEPDATRIPPFAWPLIGIAALIALPIIYVIFCIIFYGCIEIFCCVFCCRRPCSKERAKGTAAPGGANNKTTWFGLKTLWLKMRGKRKQQAAAGLPTSTTMPTPATPAPTYRYATATAPAPEMQTTTPNVVERDKDLEHAIHVYNRAMGIDPTVQTQEMRQEENTGSWSSGYPQSGYWGVDAAHITQPEAAKDPGREPRPYNRS